MSMSAIPGFFAVAESIEPCRYLTELQLGRVRCVHSKNVFFPLRRFKHLELVGHQ